MCYPSAGLGFFTYCCGVQWWCRVVVMLKNDETPLFSDGRSHHITMQMQMHMQTQPTYADMGLCL